ncbi:hypothetical protein [Tateyamaria sp.]|uniref:hypothetical protein n=1 Tax=Tateyamaria sp. TaxID=1929288 RepID=UPI00329AD188
MSLERLEMHVWTEYLSPKEKIIWGASSHATFKMHGPYLRLKRVVQYFSPVLMYVFFAFRDLPMVHVGLIVSTVAIAVYFFPRFEKPEKPYSSLAITNEGVHYCTIGGVHEFFSWSDRPEIKFSRPWLSFGGLLSAPLSVKIEKNKGRSNSRTLRWAVDATEEAVIEEKLRRFSQLKEQ